MTTARLRDFGWTRPIANTRQRAGLTCGSAELRAPTKRLVFGKAECLRIGR
jgi:hypothetical protein